MVNNVFGIQAQDIIAIVVIIGIFFLIATGRNSYLYPMLTLILGYYYGHKRMELGGD